MMHSFCDLYNEKGRLLLIVNNFYYEMFQMIYDRNLFYALRSKCLSDDQTFEAIGTSFEAKIYFHTFGIQKLSYDTARLCFVRAIC